MKTMTQPVRFDELFAKAPFPRDLFAIVMLGVVESLAGGVLTATEAVRLFFHADNCRYIRDYFQDEMSDDVMGRGVQLPDLFDVLSPEESQREFQHELTALRAACLGLLEGRRLVA